MASRVRRRHAGRGPGRSNREDGRVSANLKARNQEICDRRRTGETLESIAADYGITRERVRQIVASNGGVGWKCLADRVRDMVGEGHSFDEIVELTGKTPTQIRSALTRHNLLNTVGTYAQARERHVEIVAMFQQGHSRADLAERFGMAKGSINNILNAHGIRERRKKINREVLEAIRPAIEEDLRAKPELKLVEIGRRYGVDWSLVRNIRERMRQRQPIAA